MPNARRNPTAVFELAIALGYDALVLWSFGVVFEQQVGASKPTYIVKSFQNNIRVNPC